MEGKGYKTLVVWKKADELAKKIFTTSKKFPREELFGLTSQVRRSALSIPTNIVEGFSRKSDRELVQFLNIALGSFSETEYLLEFALDLGILTKEDYKEISRIKEETGKLLWKFNIAVKKRI